MDLEKLFGPLVVSSDSAALGDSEGDLVPATVLFPADSMRRVVIVWKDDELKRGIRTVYITGTRTLWKTPEGITFGTSLKDLERLNGRPFRLAGFGFDRGGTVTSWEGGSLERLSSGSCRLFLRVEGPAPGTAQPPAPVPPHLLRQVLGDQIFSSAHPVMRLVNPGVSEFMIVYR